MGRLGDRRRTRATLDRMGRLTAGLAVPDRPEHRYRYDPQKAHSYAATTLAWVGDPAAEQHARAVIDELEAAGGGRPRRIATAHLDLGLALLAVDKPHEASAAAMAANTSGRVVPSNWWRAAEGVRCVGRSGDQGKLGR